jgi:phage baseplate assembly protein W
MANKSININYPFKDSPKGFFLDLNTTDTEAIKADLMHLLLTNKGERLYLPDFGANLRKYLFDPYDTISEEDIKNEIKEAVKKYIPNLKITSVTTTEAPQSEYGVVVRVEYIITEDVFETKDFVIINL